MLLSFSRIAGGVVWCFLVIVNWVRLTFIKPVAEWWLDTVLGSWEESLKSIIRESFANIARFLNGLALTLTSFFDKEQNTSKKTFQKPHAWQTWWSTAKPSTFNALIARDRHPGNEGHQPEIGTGVHMRTPSVSSKDDFQSILSPPSFIIAIGFVTCFFYWDS